MAPLLGPSLGPIFGGVMTSVWNWRAIFWFLALVSGSSLLAFLLFFQDTFRPERSLTYQHVLKQRMNSADRAWLAKTAEGTTFASDVEKAGTNASARDQPKALTIPPIKLSITDVNPIRPLWKTLKRFNNIIILFASGRIPFKDIRANTNSVWLHRSAVCPQLFFGVRYGKDAVYIL